jgi:hypothetical protein
MQSESASQQQVKRHQMFKQKLQLGRIGTSFSKDSPETDLSNSSFLNCSRPRRYHQRYVQSFCLLTLYLQSLSLTLFYASGFLCQPQTLTIYTLPLLLIQICLHSNTAASKSDLLYPSTCPPFHPPHQIILLHFSPGPCSLMYISSSILSQQNRSPPRQTHRHMHLTTVPFHEIQGAGYSTSATCRFGL